MSTFYNPEQSVVPNQKLPMSKKDEEWKQSSLNAYIGKFYSGSGNNQMRRSSMKIAYDLYNGIFDEKDFKYVTDPYKVEDGFPANVRNMNIIKPKIDLLLGEEASMPFQFRVAQTNEEATGKLQEKYKEYLMAALFDIASKGDPAEPVSDKDIEQVEQIEKYITRDYSDMAEMTAYHTLNYLLEKEDIKSKFVEGFQDFNCASEVVFYTGQVNGEPVVERVNPLDFGYDASPTIKFFDDAEWGVRKMRMTASGIYNRLYDLMDEKQLDELLAKFNGSASSMSDANQFKSITWKNGPVSDSDNDEGFSDNTIIVWHAVWKSWKKVGFLTYLDESGEESTDVVDETYKPEEGEEIRWDWVTEVWEGYRIGDDMYVGIQPIAEQAISIDNPNSTKLPYTGMVFNNNNTEPKSLVDTMKPLQYFYITLWYRLELALARDKGKIINMDITQIPKSMGVDVNRWMHLLSASGVNLYNPYDNGWDIPGREGGKPANSSQFSQADLSMADVIIGYINLMNKIEEMVGEISGVSRQRQGQVQSSELVGNVQQTIVQSSYITKMLFYSYSQVKRRVLNNLLNVAKNIWHMSGKKKLSYLTDDAMRVFIDISDDFVYSDFDIFVTDSTKEAQDIDFLRQLYQPAMQNGTSLSEIASIMTSNNLTDIKNKLEKIDKARIQRETEMQQSQQDTQAQIAQMQSQIEQQRVELENRKLQLQEEDSIRKAETAIQVALIGADSKQESQEPIEGEEGIAELDWAKLAAQREKTITDAKLKIEQLNETVRHNMATESISKNKPKSTSTKK